MLTHVVVFIYEIIYFLSSYEIIFKHQFEVVNYRVDKVVQQTVANIITLYVMGEAVRIYNIRTRAYICNEKEKSYTRRVLLYDFYGMTKL